MFQVNRNIEAGEYKILDIFPDIRKSPALLEIFGSSEAAEEILTGNKAVVMDRPYYMFVSNDDGTVYISRHHLQTSPADILHLDIIHELVHVKQHRDGIELFDRTVSYVDRITEVDAYNITVREARRMGLSDDQILRYLQVEWITPDEQRRLAAKLNVCAGDDCTFIMDYEIYLRRLRSGEPANPFIKFIGALPEEIEKGHARFRLPVRAELKQINGHVQEGIIAALASETIAHAVMTRLSANDFMICKSLKSSFPAAAGEGTLIAEARAGRRRGPKISGDCIVVDESGKTVCRTKATFEIEAQ